MNNPDVLILCGGLGTRFREISLKKPKSLGIVSGKPMIKWLIDDLQKQGFNRIILATGYLSEQIEKYIRVEYNEKNIIFSKEKKQLGTGGAIVNALKYIQTNDFLVINGDSRIKENYLKFFEFHKSKNSEFSILLSSKTSGNDYGKISISSKKEIQAFKEKTNSNKKSYSNSGVYFIKKHLFKQLKKNVNYSIEKELLPEWINKKKVYGLVVNKPFYDIGTKDRFNKAKFI